MWILILAKIVIILIWWIDLVLYTFSRALTWFKCFTWVSIVLLWKWFFVVSNIYDWRLSYMFFIYFHIFIQKLIAAISIQHVLFLIEIKRFVLSHFQKLLFLAAGFRKFVFSAGAWLHSGFGFWRSWLSFWRQSHHNLTDIVIRTFAGISSLIKTFQIRWNCAISFIRYLLY